MDFKVKLYTVSDVTLFSAKCNEFKNCDIDFVYGKYVVDAKSLIGILSVGLGTECIAHIHSDNEFILDKFKRSISLWIVKKGDEE